MFVEGVGVGGGAGGSHGQRVDEEVDFVHDQTPDRRIMRRSREVEPVGTVADGMK